MWSKISDGLRKKTNGPIDLHFGGVSVAGCGDLKQIAPVKDVAVYKSVIDIIPDAKERKAANEARKRQQQDRQKAAGKNVSDSKVPEAKHESMSPYLKAANIRKLEGLEIWKSFDKCIVLQYSHRHDKDPKLKELVSSVCYGNAQQSHADFINTQLLRSHESKSTKSGVPAADHHDSILVVPSNEVRTAANIRKAREVAASHAVPLFIQLSKDTVLFESTDGQRLAISDTKMDQSADSSDQKEKPKKRGRPVKIVGSDVLSPSKYDELQQHLWYLSESATNYMPGILPLHVGMPVQLKDNIAPELGLFNGSIGTVVEIVLHADEDIRSVSGGDVRILDKMVEFVIVRFPSSEHTAVAGLEEKLVVIAPDEDTIYMTKKTPTYIKKVSWSDKTHRIIKSFKRRTLSLLPAYAFTTWLVQGLTLTRPVIFDLRRPPRTGDDKWAQMLFVLVSRPTEWKNVGVLREVSLADITTRWGPDLLAELERQNDLHVLTVPFAAELAKRYGIALSAAAFAAPRPVRLGTLSTGSLCRLT
jgi:hypothetical protein